MSKVVRFHRIGGAEELKIEERSVAAPGAGELRVRVEAIGLNRAEVMFRSGAYLEQPALPAGIGYEASAVVEALGDGVQGFTVGQSVNVIPAFSMNQYSVCAEQAIVPAYSVVPRPAGLDAVTAAGVWMAYVTAYGALVDLGRMTRGDAVIITAASSSVGLAAIQMVGAAGAVSIAVTRTRAKAEALRAAGAQHVVVTDEQPLAETVMQITGGKGARLVFDPVAGPGLEALAAAMAPGGMAYVYGALDGGATPFPLFASLQKGLSFRGYTLFEVMADAPRLQRAKDYVLQGLAAGQFKPVIAKTFPLEQIIDAYRYMESNQQIGKIVVTVG